MGQYAFTTLDVNVKCAFRAAEQYNLPAPQYDDCISYLDAKAVKIWLDWWNAVCDRGNHDHISLDATKLILLIVSEAQSYISAVAKDAPTGDAKARLKYFRKKSREYRLIFC